MKNRFAGLAIISWILLPAMLSTVSAASDRGNQEFVSLEAPHLDGATGNLRSKLTGPTRFKAIEDLKKTRLKELIEQKRYAEAADLALAGVLAWPRHLRDIEPLMELRIRALLLAGRNEEALAAAKALFNVSSMANTSAAIKHLHACVRAAHPNDKQMLAEFRKQQQAGASLTDQPPANAGMGTVMAGIYVDPAPFDAALERYGEDADGLACRGNLYLLSDRPLEARKIFEQVYENARDEDLAAATENLARCIKAEDGCIGRANKFVLDLPPREIAVLAWDFGLSGWCLPPVSPRLRPPIVRVRALAPSPRRSHANRFRDPVPGHAAALWRIGNRPERGGPPR